MRAINILKISLMLVVTYTYAESDCIAKVESTGRVDVVVLKETVTSLASCVDEITNRFSVVENLDISNTMITDIAALGELPKLEGLTISLDKKLSGLSVLDNIPSESLVIIAQKPKNRKIDIAPLRHQIDFYDELLRGNRSVQSFMLLLDNCHEYSQLMDNRDETTLEKRLRFYLKKRECLNQAEDVLISSAIKSWRAHIFPPPCTKPPCILR